LTDLIFDGLDYDGERIMMASESFQPYATARAHIKPGDVIAFSGHDLPAQVVKVATQSPYVHVAIVVWADSRAAQNDGILIAESHIDRSLPSVGTGVRRFGVQLQWLKDRVATQAGPIWWIPLRVPLAADAAQRMSQWLQMKEAGQVPYDFPQAITVGLEALGLKVRNREDDGAYFCSELVARSLQVAGVLDATVNAAAQTPAHIIQLPCFAPLVLIKAAGATV
jgi:hypothetical protein